MLVCDRKTARCKNLRGQSQVVSLLSLLDVREVASLRAPAHGVHMEGGPTTAE